MPDTILSIPLEQIMPNPDQPRRYISPGSIQRMADSLKEIGQRTEAKVRPLTGEEKTQFAPVEYMLIGGERRWRGAKLAGLPTLKAIVLNLTPEEAEDEAYTDNQRDDMTWFEKDLYIARRAKRTGLSVRRLADQMEVSKTKVHEATTIASVLTPGSIALIDEMLQSEASEDESVRPTDTQNKGFSLTRSLLLVLARLETPETVEKALRVVCDDQMTEAEAKKLVAHIQAGNPADTYGSKPAPKVAKPHADSSHQPESPTGTNPTQPSHVPRPVASEQAASPGVTDSSSGIGTAKTNASSGELSTGETIILDAMAGVSILSKVKAKLKKGEKPTTAEYFLLIGHSLWVVFHWLGKHGFKLAKWFVKVGWRFSKDNLKVLSKTWIGTLFKYACLILFLWFVGTAYFFGVSYPIQAIGKFISHHLKWENTSSTPAVSNASTSSPQVEKTSPVKPAQGQAVSVSNSNKTKTGVPTQMSASTSVVSAAQAAATPTVQKKDDVLADVAKRAGAVGGVAKALGL